jgi:hypothetical protein
MKKIICLLFVVLGFAFTTHAQDKIIQTNGQTIKCKIVEVGSTEIKYIPVDNLDGPSYTIAKEKVARIEFATGKKENVNGKSNDWKDPELYRNQRHKAIKMNFLSPLYGYAEFGFEKSTGVGVSYEASLGIIGAGKNQMLEYNYNAGQPQEIKRNQFGVFATFGYKFSKLPNFIFGMSKMNHILQGSYVKPVLYLGSYSENVMAYKGTQYVKEKQNVTFGALQLEVGKQWVFSDIFLLDIYWGLGYGADNKKQNYYNPNSYNSSDNYSAYNYANARAGRSPGLSFSGGLKMGILIK